MHNALKKVMVNPFVENTISMILLSLSHIFEWRVYIERVIFWLFAEQVNFIVAAQPRASNVPVYSVPRQVGMVRDQMWGGEFPDSLGLD